MQTNFKNIEEFLDIKKYCLFCKNKLKITLTNFIGFKNNGNPIIKSKFNKNCFNFQLSNCDSLRTIIDTKIDIRSNLLSFDIPDTINNKKSESDFIKNFFEKLLPHLEIYCSNRTCKSKHQYYLCSESFSISDQLTDGGYNIKNICLYMESFTINNFWVQNNWSKRKTNIFIKNKINTEPIEFDLLDFNNMNDDRILKKILTLISFS
jgi:hypothetical protein